MQQLPPVPPTQLPPTTSSTIPLQFVQPYLQRISYLEDKIVIGEATLKAENERLEDELDGVYGALRKTNDELRDLKREIMHERGVGVTLPSDSSTTGDGSRNGIVPESDQHQRLSSDDHRLETQRLALLADQGTRAAQRWKTRSDQLESDCSMLGMDYRATLQQSKEALAQRDVAWGKAVLAEGRALELQKSRDELEETLRRERGERKNERDVSTRAVEILQDKLDDQKEQKRQLLSETQEYSTNMDLINVALGDSFTAQQAADETIKLLQTEKSRLADDLCIIGNDFKLLIHELQSSNLNLHSGLHDLQTTNEQLTNALKTSQTEIQELTWVKEQLQAEASAKGEQVEWLRGRVEELSREVTEVRTVKDGVEGELEQMRFEKDTFHARLQSAIGRLEETESELEDARDDLETQRVEMWVVQQRLDVATTELDALRSRNETMTHDEQRGESSMTQIRQLQVPAGSTSSKERFIVQSDSGIARVQTKQPTQPITPAPCFSNFKSSIHAIIAGFLAESNAYGSLARYNVASRAVRDATLPVLYETVILDRDESDTLQLGDGVEGLAGWKHTRYLFLSPAHEETLLALAACHSSDVDRSSLLTLFPDLRFLLTWDIHTINDENSRSPEPVETCKRRLEIHGAVESRTLHGLLTSIPLRLPGCEKDESMDVRWHPNAQLAEGTLADPVVRYCRGKAQGLSVHVNFRPSGEAGNREVVRDLMAMLLDAKRGSGRIQMNVQETGGAPTVSRDGRA